MNHLTELLKKSGAKVLKEYDLQKGYKLRINADKKETIVTYTTAEGDGCSILASSLKSEEFIKTLTAIRDFVSDTTNANNTLEFEQVGGEDINVEIVRYGVDIVQIIVRVSVIGGFQLIDDTLSAYNKLKELIKSY